MESEKMKETQPNETENPSGYQGNSWVQLAMNNERQRKIREGKGFNSNHLQAITVGIALVVLLVLVVWPWLRGLLGL